MKKIILSIAIISSFISCSSKKESPKDIQEINVEEHHENEEHSDNEVELTPEQIKLAHIEIGKTKKQLIKDELAVAGEIQVPPQSKATVYAPIEAFVEKASLLPGEKVKKGQIIATLKHPKFIDVQQQYLQAIIKLNTEKANYTRKKSLYEQDIVSQKNFQTAESTYLTAKNIVESYASQLSLIGFSPKQIQTKGIQNFLYVIAPITGYITQNNMNRGKFVASNELMYEIIDDEHIHVELQVFAKDLGKVKKGSPIIFKARGIDKEYQGEVELIGTKIKEDTKTADIHGHFEDPSRIIKPGMFVEAKILSGGSLGYTLPEAALIEQDGEYFIFTPETDTHFKRLKIEKGVSQNGNIEIKAIEGDNFDIAIVTNGAYYLKGALLQNSGEMGGHHH